MQKTVRIIHTNDLHSHFENWPKIQRFVKERQQTRTDEAVITVDLGDFMDRWHPLTEATDGQANIELMNRIHYDAVTIGNNEGIGNEKKILNQLYRHANFEVVLANLIDKRTLLRPNWAKPYKKMTTDNGVTIGIIGLTAAFPLTYAPNGWDIRQEMEILPDLVQELRPDVDVLLLLSHLGIEADYRIANEMPAIDVIIGSHTHHLFENGELVNGVQLAAAGKFGRYVGEVTLTLNEENSLINKSATTYATANMLEHPEDQTKIEEWLAQGHRQLAAKELGYLPRTLKADPFAIEDSLIDVTLEALRQRGQTEVAILNSGLFLADLPVGVVNQNQLHQILPHPMHIIRVTLMGSDLIRLVLEMEKNRSFLKKFPILGMGFRGKVFGHIRYLGLRYDAINHEVRWLNQVVKPDQSYSFTTVDHYLFIPFFPTIEIAGEVEFLFPEFIRTVLGKYVTRNFPLILNES